MLDELTEGLPRVAVLAMLDGAESIQERAVKQAPVDMGNLEEAIEIDTVKIAEGHIEVFINDDMEAAGRPAGTKVGQYSDQMHEGVYKLGPKSRAKEATNGGFVVGRKFLERAVTDLTPEIMKNINSHMTQAVQHAGRGIMDIFNVLGSHRRRFTGGGVFNSRKHIDK